MNPAAAKLKMLQGSTRCLSYGLLALLPGIGLPFGLAALWISGRIRAQEKQMWNAAQPYRIAGAACGAAGLLFWVGLLAFVVAQAILASI